MMQIIMDDIELINRMLFSEINRDLDRIAWEDAETSDYYDQLEGDENED